MNEMLTFKEKRYIKNFLEESKTLDTGAWPQWVSLVLFGFGGLVMVLAILSTLNNLSATSIKLMFFPGLVAGTILLMIGAYGLHISKKIEEKLAAVGARIQRVG